MEHPEPQALGELLERASAGVEPSAEAAQQLIRSDPATPVLESLGLRADARERLRMFRAVSDLSPETHLDAAGFEVAARVSPAELWRFYLPLCRFIRTLCGQTEGRTVVGIAGCGASGKSVFAGLLRAILNRTGPAVARAALFPLDGYHYPNAYLEERFTTDEDGRRVSLRSIKGAPETFNARAYVEDLRRVHTESRVRLPRYDRNLHDPVPDAMAIEPADRIVLTEGNYLLLDRGPWADVRRLLRLAVFVFLPRRVIRRLMIERHMRGGKSRPVAVRKYEDSDRSNARLIASTMPRADLAVRRSADQKVEALERIESTG